MLRQLKIMKQFCGRTINLRSWTLIQKSLIKGHEKSVLAWRKFSTMTDKRTIFLQHSLNTQDDYHKAPREMREKFKKFNFLFNINYLFYLFKHRILIILNSPRVCCCVFSACLLSYERNSPFILRVFFRGKWRKSSMRNFSFLEASSKVENFSLSFLSPKKYKNCFCVKWGIFHLHEFSAFLPSSLHKRWEK